MHSYQNAYYTNTSRIRLRGAAEPESWMELLVDGEPVGMRAAGTEIVTPAIKIGKSGVWEVELDLASVVGSEAEAVLELTPVAYGRAPDTTR